jgi:hypothetical protein
MYYVCIYVCIYIQDVRAAHTDAHMHTYIHRNMYTYLNTHLLLNYRLTPLCNNTPMHVHPTVALPKPLTFSYVYISMYKCTYIVHKHTHTYTNTHTQPRFTSQLSTDPSLQQCSDTGAPKTQTHCCPFLVLERSSYVYISILCM